MNLGETLRAILSCDMPSPEISLEEDGDFYLDFQVTFNDKPCDLGVSIHSAGTVNWVDGETREHGTDLNRLLEILKGLSK